ncbi:MAG: SLC26A/SulP transporter family protein [Burkholderiales bacterium]|nr:SLC26A/SulP transporter family protein [Burkholderiales bacterium]
MNESQAGRLSRRIFPNLFASRMDLSGDIGGALNGALVSIPQILAFGILLGSALGPDRAGFGMLIALYGSVLVGAMTSIFGGSPFVVTGTRASAVLVLAALIRQLSISPALAGFHDPVSTAFALACGAVVLAGLLQFCFGAFRLGKLVDYVPLPVMLGFINGTALLIITSQIPDALGISGPLYGHLDSIRFPTLLLALATALSVRLFPYVTKQVPPMPLAFLFWMAAYHLLSRFGLGEALGGSLPPPPEHFSLHFALQDATEALSGSAGADLLPILLGAAFSMAILSTLDTLLATAATDEITSRRSDAGRQLMAEGIGNLLAGMFGLAPGSGGLGRTRAALAGGMKSSAATAGISLVTLFVVLTLSPLIGLLSKAVMAGLLIALGFELVDRWSISRLFRAFSRKMPASAFAESMVVVVVVAAALVFDLKTAVGIGLLLSLLSFVAQMAKSPVRRSYRASALIPKIYGDASRRNFIEQHGRRIAVIEIEGALFFGTVSELGRFVEDLVGEGVHHVVLDMKRVKHVDATGARGLERMHARLDSKGGLLVVSHVGREGRQAGEEAGKHSTRSKLWIELSDIGTVARIGEDCFHEDNDSAIEMCEKHLAKMLPPQGEEGNGASMVKSLDAAMLRRLRRYLERTSYEAGEVVFSQGSEPDGAYYVISGRVDVFIELRGTGRKVRLQSLTSGSVFGEMAMLDAKPRSAGILAVEPTVCYRISSACFEKMRREHADLAFALLADIALVFAERLRANVSMIAELEL